VTNFRNQ